MTERKNLASAVARMPMEDILAIKSMGTSLRRFGGGLHANEARVIEAIDSEFDKRKKANLDRTKP